MWVHGCLPPGSHIQLLLLFSESYQLQPYGSATANHAQLQRLQRARIGHVQSPGYAPTSAFASPRRHAGPVIDIPLTPYRSRISR